MIHLKALLYGLPVVEFLAAVIWLLLYVSPGVIFGGALVIVSYCVGRAFLEEKE